MPSAVSVDKDRQNMNMKAMINVTGQDGDSDRIEAPYTT